MQSLARSTMIQVFLSFFQADGPVGGWMEKEQDGNTNALQNIALVGHAS